jgi:O2-independent ubiquinone biosynthesis accessory factor UbiT
MRGQLPSNLGSLMAHLPLLPLELISQRLAANVTVARPSLFVCLESRIDCAFAIDPTDCPFVFLVTLTRSGVSMRLVREIDRTQIAARIAAPLIVLLGLLDGAYDGDALFFSRDLVIEGDTAAVIALSNALEDAEIDAAAILDVPDRLAAPAQSIVCAGLDFLRQALGAPPTLARTGAARWT